MDVDRQYSEGGGVQRREKDRRNRGPYGYVAAASRADADAKWTHNVFADDSTVYGPKLYGKSAPAPSPSLQPFGSFTPPVDNANGKRPARQQQPAPRPRAELSLLDRLDGKAPKAGGAAREAAKSRKLDLLPDTSSNPLFKRLGLRDAAKQAKRNNQVQQRQPREEAPLAPRVRQEPKETRQASIRGAANPQPEPPATPTGTTVVVSNLVNGTTSEDVKAALSEFGTITSCEVGQMPNSILFYATIVFTEAAGAETAKASLDGVLADGERLKVEVMPPSGPRARLGASRNGAFGDTASRLGAPARNSTLPPPVAASPFPTESGKMRSDIVMTLDPRAHVQTDPLESQQRGRPTGPRRGRRGGYRGGRQGGGGGGGGMDVD